MQALLRPDVSLPPAIAGAAFLRDGTEVWIRPVREGDPELVREFLRREPHASFAPQYLTAIRPDRAGAEVVALDPPDDRLCLLALGNRTGAVAVLGVGEYARTRPAVAAIAFLVAGPYRGRGVATLLLARLARAARAFGILRFEARVGEDNLAMLELFRASGLPFTEEAGEGTVDIVVPLVPEGGTAPVPDEPSAPTAPRESDPGGPAGTPGRPPRRRPPDAAQPG